MTTAPVATTRTIADVIADPRAGDMLQRVVAQTDTHSHICTLVVTHVSPRGTVYSTLHRHTITHGRESHQEIERPRQPLARWQRTNFSGYDVVPRS